MSITVSLDKRKLEKLIRESPRQADRIVGEIAFEFQKDIQENFSRHSPSAPGEPPGVVTGTLRNSIYTGRIQTGLWRVAAGTKYAAMLEWGTTRMAARPFMRPAARRILPRVREFFKELVK